MKYVVIKRHGSHLGLLSYVITNIGAINKFIKKGYIPIIDMCNEKNQYISENQIGKVNAWELYFEQPCGLTLNDISNSDYIIFDKVIRNRPSDSMRFFLNKKINKKWKNVAKQYLILKPEVENIINDYQKKYFSKNDRVLGVLCRGTDYVSLKPFRHPIQPSIDELFKKIDDVLIKYNCNKVFLATEDENILNSFKEKYGSKLIYHHQKRYKNTGKHFLSEIKASREDDYYLRGLEYLTSIVLLSKCNCFVGGVTSGTVGVQLFNPNFEYEYYFNKGRYGMPRFIRYYYKQK